MRLPKWALAALAGLFAVFLILVAIWPSGETATRERRVAEDMRIRRAALGRITPPEVPTSLREDSDSIMREAVANYRAGRYGPASAKLHDLSARHPDNVDLRFLLGGCYLMTRDFDAAAAELKTAIALAPERAERARILLAKAHIARDRDAEAEFQLRQAINLQGPLQNEARDLLRAVQTLD